MHQEVKALKEELERAQAVKEKFKTTAIKVRKKCDKLRDALWPPPKPGNEKPRGPERKQKAETSSKELYALVRALQTWKH